MQNSNGAMNRSRKKVLLTIPVKSGQPRRLPDSGLNPSGKRGGESWIFPGRRGWFSYLRSESCGKKEGGSAAGTGTEWRAGFVLVLMVLLVNGCGDCYTFGHSTFLVITAGAAG